MQRLPINNVNDLIVARNVLRETLSEANIRQLPLHARAAAGVTAMCEFILKAGTKGVLSLSITEKDDKIGVELSCEITWLGIHLKTLAHMRHQQVTDLRNLLTRVTDDVECNDRVDAPLLVIRIWSSEGETR